MDNINKTIKIFERQANQAYKELEYLKKKVNQFLVGKKIIINKESFNGQPYGRSKPSLKGWGYIFAKDNWDWVGITNEGELYIQPPNCNDAILLKDCIVSEG